MKLTCLKDSTVKFAISRLGVHNCGMEKCGNLEARCAYRLKEFKLNNQGGWGGYWDYYDSMKTNDELQLLLKLSSDHVKTTNAKMAHALGIDK